MQGDCISAKALLAPLPVSRRFYDISVFLLPSLWAALIALPEVALAQALPADQGEEEGPIGAVDERAADEDESQDAEREGEALQVESPQVLREVPAEYPSGETDAARVELIVTLDADGKVSGLSISKSAGQAFDAAALGAVARWEFQPATKDGIAVSAKIRVAIDFKAPVQPTPDPPPEVTPPPAAAAMPDAAVPSAAVPPQAEVSPTDNEGDMHLEVTVHGDRELRTERRSASDFFIHREVLKTAPRQEGADALTAAPGLTIARSEGPAVAHSYNLRGFDAAHGQDIEFTVAGLPINLPSHIHGQGYADLNFLIGEVVDELRVSEGVSDPVQGDFAVAGSVAIGLGVDDEHRGLQVRSSYGSFNTFQQSLVWAPKESARENFGAAHFTSSSGFGENRGGMSGSAIVQHRFGEGELSYRAVGFVHAARADHAGVLRRDDIDSESVCFHCVYSYPTAEAQNGSAGRIMAGLFADYRGVEHASGSIGLWVGHDDFRVLTNATGFLEQSERLAGVYGRGDLIEQHNQTNSVGLTGRYRTEAFTPSSWAHGTVEVGAEGRFDSISQQQNMIDAAVRNQRWDSRVDADIVGLQVSMWGDLDWQLGSMVQARLGARGTVLSYDVEDVLGNLAPVSRPQDASLPGYRRSSLGIFAGPRTSVEVRPYDYLSVMASYGEGYRSPQARTLDDGENAPFARVRSADLGLRVHDADRLSMTLVGYLTSMSDDVAFDPTEGGLSRLGATLRKGATLYATTRPAHWLLGSLAVTYVHATLLEPPPRTASEPDPPFVKGQLLPYVPPLVVRAEIATKNVIWQRAGRFPLMATTGLGFTFRSPRPLPYGQWGDPWNLLDASAGLLWGPFDFTVSAYNLFNTDYAAEEYVYTSDWHPGEPTSRVPAEHIVAGAPLSVMATLGLTL